MKDHERYMRKHCRHACSSRIKRVGGEVDDTGDGIVLSFIGQNESQDALMLVQY